MKEVKFGFNLESTQARLPEKERGKVSTEKALRNVGQFGKRLAQYAVEVEAMLEEANARGMNVDLSSNETFKKFAPLGDYELVLTELSSKLLELKTVIADQGLKMTQEEMNERLKKMGKD